MKDNANPLNEFIKAADLYIRRGYDEEHDYTDGQQVRFRTLVQAAVKLELVKFDPIVVGGNLGYLILPDTNVVLSFGPGNLVKYATGETRPANILLRSTVLDFREEARARLQLG